VLFVKLGFKARKRMKIELFFYVFAIIILIVFGRNTSFSTDFLNLIGNLSGVLALLGIVACAVALLWRRIKILNNRKTFGDKAEAVESNVSETVFYVFKVMVGIWLILVAIGFVETLKQYL
jgi:hypothetical protein